MILILSEKDDYSTSKVSKWLLHNKQNFLRINSPGEIALSTIEMRKEKSNSFSFNNLKIDFTDIKSFWYRRGKIKLLSKQKITFPKEDIIGHSLKNIQREELQVLESHFYDLMDHKKSIGSFRQSGINKVFALNKALDVGLEIPDTLVTGDKEKLLSFKTKHQKVIVKPIFEMPFFNHDRYQVFVYTSMVKDTVIDSLDDHFFPSLFQEAIPKKYELRIFYLDGECYANAIFTQMSEQTTVDSRRYNYKTPNRRVPYQLPQEISQKIKSFMQSIHLNCGSIDMIYSQNKEYVFLEVNPIGQFGMTSYLGNYRLEQKIAKYFADA